MPGELPSRSRRPARSLVLLATLLVVASVATPRPATAQSAPEPGQPLKAGQSVPIDGSGARISPELAGVAVHSAELDRREGTLASSRGALDDAEAGKRKVQDELLALDGDREKSLRAVADAEGTVAEATVVLEEAEGRLAEREEEEDAAVERRDAAREEIRTLAVAAYMQPDDGYAWLSNDSREVLAAGNERVLSQAVGDERLEQLAERAAELEVAEEAVRKAGATVDDAERTVDDRRTELEDRLAAVSRLDERIVETQGKDREADERVAGANAQVVADAASVADARVLATLDDADFPLLALDAYWKAAASAPCPVEWWALAGITKVESGHGTYRGASLDARGVASPAIIGIPLDGTNGTAVIRDTDGGRFDFDTAYDRAVGPMQFIPSTWASWARDGNGDGVASPHDLYDVAQAAAAYLCATADDLSTEAGLRRGYYAYNHSNAYVQNVLNYAYDYRSSVDL